jgi:predicted dehydrogenase
MASKNGTKKRDTTASEPNGPNRRRFLATTAATAATLSIPTTVHAGVDETLRIGLVGAGGRGSGAVVDALTADPNTKLVAIGDAFQDRAEKCLKNLQAREGLQPRLDVGARLFSGFDAYQQVIDECDVVLLATPPHFRPDHLEYAVNAGKHCFVEKPVAVDAAGVVRVKQISELAKEKGLAVVSGLCWRYHPAVMETVKRIKDGAIGDIISIQSQYNTGTLWHRGDDPKWSRMEYQIRNWLYYTWLSGDHIAEQAIHSLDKTAWLQDDASPVRATGMGGRIQRVDPMWGNIYDHHCVFYEYASGIRVYFTCRQQAGCSNHVDEIVLGTKGTAQILKNTITPHDGPEWKYEGEKPSMYEEEHRAMFASIRNGAPINNGHYMTNSTMLAIMGRMCTYQGKTLTWEECLADPKRLGPSQYDWIDIPEPKVAIPGIPAA